MLKEKNSKKIVLYILLAFAFSVGVRMIWVYQFSDVSNFFWNGQLMINTNDGYYFAEGARDAINGFHQPNDISPIDNSVSLLTAWLVKILPFSFESIILYMPTVLGSLLVIPLVLIGKSLKNIEMGFIAALLASIALSYYNRTMTGYYDTDMLNIVFPTFIFWALIRAIQSQELRYLLYLALFESLYVWWYPQGYSLEVAFFGLVLLYTLVFDLKNSYLHKMVVVMLFSMIKLSLYVKIGGIILLFILFKSVKEKNHLFLGALFFIGIVLFFLTGGFSPIWGSLKGYIFKEMIEGGTGDIKLHFFSVVQTVREASQISFQYFSERISGNIITFFVSICGFVWLCFRHPIVLLSLPMLGLGFLAYSGGLRFTVYAVPVLALGVGYLIVKLGDLIGQKVLRYIVISILTISILYPNIVHVKNYKVPTVFNNEEVKVIDYLKKGANREDYVISWWDYGYPLRYYGDVKTLVDGSIHHGDNNFAPSFILTNPQDVSAKMARIEVEFLESSYKDKNLKATTNMERILNHYNYKDSNDFLLSLQNDIKLPEKTRDIFIYLPFRMMGIYPTVAKFSHIDLMTGKMKQSPFLYMATDVKDEENSLYLGDQITLDKKSGVINISDNKVLLKSFYVTEYDRTNQLNINVQNFHKNGQLSIIYAAPYNAIYLMDNNTLNSTYIQLFLLENYNKKLYEPVVLNPYAKLYKLKK